MTAGTTKTPRTEEYFTKLLDDVGREEPMPWQSIARLMFVYAKDLETKLHTAEQAQKAAEKWALDARDKERRAVRDYIQATRELAGVRQLLREAFAWGINLKHKKDCPEPASNFMKHKHCECGRDALHFKLNDAAFHPEAIRALSPLPIQDADTPVASLSVQREQVIVPKAAFQLLRSPYRGLHWSLSFPATKQDLDTDIKALSE